MCELLVGLPDVNVLGIDDVVGQPLQVHVELRSSRTGCETCGVFAWVKDRPVVDLVGLPCFGRPTHVLWHKRRLWCPEPSCTRGSWTEDEPGIAAPRMGMTDRAGRWITEQVECEKVAAQCAADNVAHLGYLLQLLELELLDREKRAAERRLKGGGFPATKKADTFYFTARPSVNKMLISELARCEYIDKRENVLMIGNPGTGKSHLATALAAAACHKGYRVRFFRTTELVTALIEARDERTFLRLKGQLAKLDLLVLDELGYVPASKVGVELLFDVIATAYERTSLIVTSNLPFSFLDRGPRIGAPHRRHSRPAHPPVPDHRDQGRELSAAGRQIQDCPGHGPEGSNRLERDCHHACGRGANHQVASDHRATVFDRCALLNWTGVHKPLIMRACMMFRRSVKTLIEIRRVTPLYSP